MEETGLKSSNKQELVRLQQFSSSKFKRICFKHKFGPGSKEKKMFSLSVHLELCFAYDGEILFD